jgi:hypothetical protein
LQQSTPGECHRRIACDALQLHLAGLAKYSGSVRRFWKNRQGRLRRQVVAKVPRVRRTDLLGNEVAALSVKTQRNSLRRLALASLASLAVSS